MGTGGIGRGLQCSAAGTAPGTHPCGARSVTPGALPGTWTLRNAASGPIRARFQVISGKVSQNGGVSPKYVQKAYVSPCFQNAAQKSPLEILRFPFSSAFSHKELMAHFRPGLRFIVKMTKCRLDVHTHVREGSVRYPHGHASQLATVAAPHLPSARAIS